MASNFWRGGVTISGSSLPFRIKSANSDFIERKKKAQKLKWQYLNGEAVKKESFLALNYEGESILDAITEIHGMDLESYGILSVYDIELIRFSRMRNANILHQIVKELSQVEEIILCKNDTVPLYYPVYTNDREGLQAFLRERDIFAPVLWTVPELVQPCINEDVAYIYEHLLAIPCDHRYNETDMKRIGMVLQEYEKSN